MWLKYDDLRAAPYLASKRVSSMTMTWGCSGTSDQKQKPGAANEQPSVMSPHVCLR